MTRDSDPADTRMMGIVHAALRRDLERVREAVTTERPAGLPRGRPSAHRPLASALREAGRRYGERVEDEARSTLAKAIDALAQVLYPHLDREVGEAMPVVSASITRAEWLEVEETYTIKPKSLPQLAMEAQWVIDGIDVEEYAVVHDTVPRLMRWVVLRGFAGRYRRTARLRWEAGPEARLVEAS